MIKFFSEWFGRGPSKHETPEEHSIRKKVPHVPQGRTNADTGPRSQKRPKNKPSKPALISKKTSRGLTKKNYQVTNDGTALDELVKELLLQTSAPLNGVLVSGLSGVPSNENHRCFKEMKRQAPLRAAAVKNYFVRLRLPYEASDEWGLGELFPDNLWENGFDNNKSLELIGIASEHIEASYSALFERKDNRIGVSYSRGNEQYVSFAVELPITAFDVLVHCPTNLSPYGQDNLKDISQIVADQMAKRKKNISSLYWDRRLLQRVCRAAENLHRKRSGIPAVGEGWVNQSKLFNLVKQHFPGAKSEHSPKWLGKQRLDIYIPGHKAAIEYHGLQHYEPVGHFGGEETFNQTVERDQLKSELCIANGVRLFEWPYTRPVNEKEVYAFVAALMSEE